MKPGCRSATPHLLECSHHALEDAGYDPQRYEGLIGVYAGSSISSYLSPASLDAGVLAAAGEHQVPLGNDKDLVPTRAFLPLNLKDQASMFKLPALRRSLRGTWLVRVSLAASATWP